MRTVLVLLLLTLGLAGCGTGDATTDPATPQPTTTTDAPTDGTEDPAAASGPADDGTPIPVEGDGDIGDGSGSAPPLEEAPDFGVSTETDSAAISPFTACWRAPADDAPTCSDGPPRPDAVVLAGSDQLVITFAEGQLSATGAASDATSDADLPVAQETPGIWLVDTSGLDAGDHVITLSWQGDQGDAATTFTLSVQR